jgi:hypothetical protein
MYINPVLVGIIGTLFVEVVLIFGYAIYKNTRGD